LAGNDVAVATPCLYAMPTELPYAADAEVSLSYDELQVRTSSTILFLIKNTNNHEQKKKELMIMTFYAGSTNPIPERSSSSAYHCSDEIQLCVGAGEEPYKGESGGRGAVIARRVFDNEAFGHLIFFC
jgi:hypothetical protein